jgi:hypothetical protein
MCGWLVQEIEWGVDDIGHGLVERMVEVGKCSRGPCHTRSVALATHALTSP